MSAVVFSTGQISVAEMVNKVSRERYFKKEALRKQDEQLTEIFMGDTPGMRLGKHRAEPVQAAAYLPETEEPKHIDKEFVAPKSLFELVNS